MEFLTVGTLDCDLDEMTADVTAAWLAGSLDYDLDEKKAFLQAVWSAVKKVSEMVVLKVAYLAKIKAVKKELKRVDYLVDMLDYDLDEMMVFLLVDGMAVTLAFDSVEKLETQYYQQ